MPEMTAAEALARAWEIIDGGFDDYQEAAADMITRLRSLGFVIVPVEADEAMVERGALSLWEAWRTSAVAPELYADLSWADLTRMASAGNCATVLTALARGEVREAYAAMVAPDTEKGNG